ncbi:MAG: tetratricopeptide repeat protein, partial [Opitutaceae bacterium]
GFSRDTSNASRLKPLLPRDLGADRLRAWSLILALVGYGVFSLTDFQLDVPVFGFAVSFCLALLATHLEGRPPCRPIPISTQETGDKGQETEAGFRSLESNHLAQLTPVSRPLSLEFPRLAVALFIVAALAFIGSYAIPGLRARHAFVSGVEKLEAGDAESFVENTRRAMTFAPRSVFYPTQLGMYLATRDPRAAIEQLTRSLEIDPDQEVCHFNLGWLLLASDPAAAARHFREAARLVPDKGGVYFGLGLALVRAGRGDEAPRAYALEWINAPASITAPAWESPQSRDRRNATAASANNILESLAADVALPEPMRQRARYAQALFRWWLEPDTDNTAAAAKHEPDSGNFFRALTGTRTPPANSRTWPLLFRAWQASDPGAVLAALPPHLAGLREPLLARIEAHRNSFADLITAPVAATPELVLRYHRERVAYGMLMHNSDGLRITDIYKVEENALATRFLTDVFPPKGWLTGPALAALLERGQEADPL